MEQPWVILWLLLLLLILWVFRNLDDQNEYTLNETKFYLRYVDDILAAFQKDQDSLTSYVFRIRDILKLNFP